MKAIASRQLTAVVVPALLALALVVASSIPIVTWQRRTAEASIRSDILGRERMLTVSTVDLAARAADRPEATAQLLRGLDLLVDQWMVGVYGGAELDLSLRPTGRQIGPWVNDERFDETERRLASFVDRVRAGVEDGIDADELEVWRDDADELVAELITVVGAASTGRDDHLLWLGLAGITSAFGALTWAAALQVGRRRRTVEVTLERANAYARATERFERILRDSPDDIILLGARGELVWASSGLGVGGTVASTAHLRSLVHPDDAEMIDATVRQAFLTPGMQLGSCRLRASYGQWRHTEVLVTNLLDDAAVEAVVLTIRDVTDRERAEADQRRLADLNEFLTSNASEVMVRLDEDRRVTYVTAGIGPLLEISPDDAAGMDVTALLHPDSRATFDGLVQQATSTGALARGDVELSGAASGITVWVSAGVRAVAVGDTNLFHISFLDVTDRRSVERELAVAAERQQLILDTLSEGVTLSHRDHGVVLANRVAIERFGVAVTDEHVCDQVLRRADRIEEADGTEMGSNDSPTDRVFRTGEADVERHLRLVMATGPAVELFATAAPCGRDTAGDVDLVALTFSDVTARVLARQQLERQANHDSLTGLSNRHRVEQLLTDAVNRNRRRPHHVTVLFIDLDGFKAVNDTYGHGIGDDVLVATAQRILSAVRTEDVVGRLGGDEFVVVIEDADSELQAKSVVERLDEVLHAPFELADEPVVLGASIGVATLRRGQEASDLLTAADERMYAQKRCRPDRLTRA